MATFLNIEGKFNNTVTHSVIPRNTAEYANVYNNSSKNRITSVANLYLVHKKDPENEAKN